MSTEQLVAPEEHKTAQSKPRPWTIFASGAFRKLWAATALSFFGYFFSYIAEAWLVLQLTGSSLALGGVLVVGAVPRALLMLVGGAVTDRLSPRMAMVASMGVRALLVAPFAVVVISGRAQMWQVYVIALVLGAADAFFVPARTSILPRVVADTELEAGNAVLNITGQTSLVIGPVIGGLIVATLGTGWAFAGDAVFFAIGLLLVLWLPSSPASAAAPRSSGGLAGQIVAGLRYAWSDFGIRLVLIVVAVIDFAANGAIGVGLPVLAHGRYAAGATGLGVLFAAWGVGATVGAIGAGMVPPPKRMGLLVVALCVWLGLGMVGVGLVPTLLPAAVLMGVSGIGTGVVNTYGISWLQRRTDRGMQGRVMSLIMFASVGLTPIGYAASGFAAQLNPTVLFLIAGGMMLACAVGAVASARVRSLT
ncbi:MAG TPA: MFS transporter [Candidatus Dormibacteraeota bacterium]|nr:MFS transporter [Candidatus Dormibacteraeota bacterium]